MRVLRALGFGLRTYHLNESHETALRLQGKLACAFLPNSDMQLAKALVAGCDLWLNTPMPPMEASGTSGAKASLNGGLNLNVLDGWWIEGCVEGVTGWSVGRDGTGSSDHSDTAAL